MRHTYGSSQAKQDTTELESRGKALKEGIGAAEKRLAEVEVARDAALAQIGNLVHDSVPVDDDEVRGQGAESGCCYAGTSFRAARASVASVAGNTHSKGPRKCYLFGVWYATAFKPSSRFRPMCTIPDDQLAPYCQMLRGSGWVRSGQAGCPNQHQVAPLATKLMLAS